jgi:adenine-specific DNA-methyltransferase
MRLKTLSLKQSLSKAYLKQRPLKSQIDRFRENLAQLLTKVENKESEENKKNHVRDFLLDTYYKGRNEINTKDRKDLVIHLDKTNTSNAGVILEAKSLENLSEMMRRDRPNAKAFRELVLYYFDERIEKGNSELKQLIVTNAHEWFIFDANAFDKHIYRNASLKRLYETYKNDGKSNPFIYDEIKTQLETLGDEIP